MNFHDEKVYIQEVHVSRNANCDHGAAFGRVSSPKARFDFLSKTKSIFSP